MPISISEDIKPVSELKKRTRQVFEQIHRTGRPVVVTVNGKPDIVLLDAAVFEKRLKAMNLGVFLSEAENEAKKGLTRPAKDFLKEFKQSAKTSR